MTFLPIGLIMVAGYVCQVPMSPGRDEVCDKADDDCAGKNDDRHESSNDTGDCGAFDEEYIILRTTINTVELGDRLYLALDDGDYLTKVSDLQQSGINASRMKGRVWDLKGEQWISLKSMAHSVRYEVSLEQLTISIDVDISLLGSVNLEVSDKASKDTPVTTQEGSSFLNYSVTAQCYHGDWKNCYYPGVAELGTNFARMLLYSNMKYHFQYPEAHAARGMTNLTADFPSKRSRLVVGDMHVRPTQLGSGGLIGGFGYWTEYSVDPYFIRYPRLSFAGTTTTPAQVEVYLNDTLIRKFDVPAGQFGITNIASTAGQGEVKILTRDAYGRESIMFHPYFTAPALLRQGVKEEGAYVGFLRSEYGQKNFFYTEPAFFFRYRQGVFDWFTVGGDLEGTLEMIQTALETNFLVFNTMAVSFNIAGSTVRLDYDGAFVKPGAAFSTRWHMIKNPLTVGMDVSYYQSSYTTAVSYHNIGSNQRRLVTIFWTGLSMETIGSIRFGSSATLYHGSGGHVNTYVGFNRNLFRSLSMSVMGTAGRSMMDSRWQGEVSLILTYSFKNGVSLAGNVRGDSEGYTVSKIGVQKSPPFGEGFGGRANVTVATSPKTDTASKRVSPGYNLSGTYRGRHGVWWSDALKRPGGPTVYSISAAGGLVFVGGSFRATRPINDSFGLIKASDSEGIPVLLSNREVGKTDSDGEVVIPDLNAYQENNISLDAGGLPLDYSLMSTTKILMPRHRSGVYYQFRSEKFTAITGRVKTVKNGEDVFLKFGKLSLSLEGREESCPTGFDGEFYLENVPAGTHEAVLDFHDEKYICLIEVPEPKGFIMEIGEVTCE